MAEGRAVGATGGAADGAVEGVTEGPIEGATRGAAGTLPDADDGAGPLLDGGNVPTGTALAPGGSAELGTADATGLPGGIVIGAAAGTVVPEALAVETGELASGSTILPDETAVPEPQATSRQMISGANQRDR